MKVHYNFDDTTIRDGEVDLDPASELAYEDAESEAERRAIIEAAIVASADDGSAIHRRTIEYTITNDDDEQ